MPLSELRSKLAQVEDALRKAIYSAIWCTYPPLIYAQKIFGLRPPWAEIWGFSFFRPQNRGKSFFEPADHILFGAKFLFYGKMCVSVST